MYVELQIVCTCISQLQIHTWEKPIRGNNLHICVYGCEIKKEMSPIAHCVDILNKCLQSMSVLHAVSSSLFVKHTYQLHTVSPAPHSFSSTLVTFDCCLHQRTPLNSDQLLKLQRRRYVSVGLNRTNLIMLTISVITAGQLNVNSLFVKHTYQLHTVSPASWSRLTVVYIKELR